MKRTLLIIGFILPFIGFSQDAKKVVPGYLGKRWVFDYSLNFMPSVGTGNPGANTEYNGSGSNVSSFFFNTQHKLSAERVVGRKFSIVGTVLFSRNQAEIERTFETAPSDFVQINTTGYIFTVRHYRKHLAPVSKYFDYKLGFYNIAPQEFEYTARDIETDSLSNQTISAASIGDIYMGFGWGNSRIIKDKVVFSFGFELGFLVGGAFEGLGSTTVFNELGSTNPNSAQNEEVIQSVARQRMFFESLLNFTVRIGFMP